MLLALSFAFAAEPAETPPAPPPVAPLPTVAPGPAPLPPSVPGTQKHREPAADPSAPHTLYVGVEPPIGAIGLSSRQEAFVALDLLPVAVEWRFAPRLGLRADALLAYQVAPFGGWNDAQVTVQMPIYLGPRAVDYGMRGVFFAPVLAFELAGSPAVGTGLGIGYSGKLGPVLRWRISAWAGAGVRDQEIEPIAGGSAFEVGGFVR